MTRRPRHAPAKMTRAYRKTHALSSQVHTAAPGSIEEIEERFARNIEAAARQAGIE